MQKGGEWNVANDPFAAQMKDKGSGNAAYMGTSQGSSYEELVANELPIFVDHYGGENQEECARIE
eukprot:11580957-Karenia_brevis.AAC.1